MSKEKQRMKTLTTQIGVNILGSPIYYELKIFEHKQKYSGKTQLTFSQDLITQL